MLYYTLSMGEEQQQGFFKTTPEPERFTAAELAAKRVPPNTSSMIRGSQPDKTDTKFRRVAKFFVLIGSDRAAEILARLPPDQVEAVSREISNIKTIGPEESQAILEEFGSLLSSSGLGLGVPSGGVEAARRILYAAFGTEKGEKLLIKAVPEAKPNPFDFLEDFTGEQLAMLFKEESPAAAALVFSRLPPKLSAEALTRVTNEKKLEILKRIAKQSAVSPEVLEQVAGALREKAKNYSVYSKTGDIPINGMDTLAAILKSSGIRFGGEILSQLEQEDPELGKTLKEKILNIADILGANDLPIQKKLASMNDRDIIHLLKARSGYEDSAAFREKILQNLSQGRREAILEEESIVGAVPRRDVEEAARVFLAWFTQSREQGGIILMEDDDLVL
jgi:flagellar motor switch protein FliG